MMNEVGILSALCATHGIIIIHTVGAFLRLLAPLGEELESGKQARRNEVKPNGVATTPRTQ